MPQSGKEKGNGAVRMAAWGGIGEEEERSPKSRNPYSISALRNLLVLLNSASLWLRPWYHANDIHNVALNRPF